jgi:hypothetical protein
MNIAEAKQQIKNAVRAYLQRDDAGMYLIAPERQRPMFLMGAPGIGKTAIIRQIAQELQIGVVSYSMTHHTRQSALGLPQIVEREYQGHSYEASEYTMSEIIDAIYHYMQTSGEQRGILFLDEINCVSETLHPSMLQFLQFKTFGRHKVPDGWVIVCAGNPPEYNRSVHDFDIVTLDRLRELDVEPEYPTWRRYAIEKGLHPAVTTFLQTKPDYFYQVTSKPGGGKSFVTARGWEDLADVIALYEKTGIPCDRVLFDQFLRDDEIAERFAVYYSLFEKYRSDYQIASVLEGSASRDIVERARDAAFDERIALLGLILDALSVECARALDRDKLVLALRDALRQAKPQLLAGASVEETIVAPTREREEELERKTAAGTASQSFARGESLFVRKMRDIAAACMQEGTESGPAAFETVNSVYHEQADSVEPLVKEVQEKIQHAIEFVEECFSDGREILVFLAELSTRTTTTQFVSKFGSDAYYKYNDKLKVDEARSNLAARVRDLDDIMDEIKNGQFLETQSLDMGSGAGLGLSDSNAKPKKSE